MVRLSRSISGSGNFKLWKSYVFVALNLSRSVNVLLQTFQFIEQIPQSGGYVAQFNSNGVSSYKNQI